MRGFRALIVVLLFSVVLIGMSACDGSGKNDYFANKEEALKYVKEKEDVSGNMDSITTVEDEELFVAQTRQDTYFIGELIESKHGYKTERISDNVEMVEGASWELTTSGGNTYTIYFERDKHDSAYVQLSDEEYNILLVEGHTITENALPFESAIKRAEVRKD